MKKLFTLVLLAVVFTFTGCNCNCEDQLKQINGKLDTLIVNDSDESDSITSENTTIDSLGSERTIRFSDSDKNRELLTKDGIWKLDYYTEFIDTCQHEHVIGNMLCIGDKKYAINNTSQYWNCFDLEKTYNIHCEFIAYDENSQRLLLDCGIKLLIFDFKTESFETISTNSAGYRLPYDNASILTYFDLNNIEYECDWTNSSSSVEIQKFDVCYLTSILYCDIDIDIEEFGGYNDMPETFYWDVKSQTVYNEDNNICVNNVSFCTTDYSDVFYVLTTDGTLYARPLSNYDYQHYSDWDTLYEKNEYGFYILANNVLGIYRKDFTLGFIVEHNEAQIFYDGYPIIRFN